MTSAPSASSPFRIAIVGAGKIALCQHVPAITASPDFELVAAVDPVADIDGVPNFRTLDDLLASGRPLDAVALCCPPQYRAALARQALDAGLVTLLEKPPAASLAEAEAVVAHARGLPNAVLFAAWHSRFAPMIAAAADALAGETIARGKIIWREDVDKWHPNQPWLWLPGGFGVLDPGINALSILTAITDGRYRVTRSAFRIYEHPDAPVAAEITLDDGAAEIGIDLDFRHEGAERWTIELETASGRRIALADGGARLDLDGAAVEPTTDDGGEYAGVYRRFAEVARSRRVEVDLEPLRIALDAIAAADCRPAATAGPEA